MHPLVSVIIPNYNHYPYLKERIESVLNQTFQDFELLIMDDLSTDSSKEIIEQYRHHSKVAKIIFNEVNSGSTFKQWNTGISLAQGELIWIAESDDVADPNLLKTLVSSFSDKRMVLSFCQSYRLNSANEIRGTWEKFMKDTDEMLFNDDFIIEGKEFINRSLIHKNTIPNASSLLFSKAAYVKIGGANEQLRYCSDWLTWLEIACLGKVAYHKKPYNYFRFHSSSVISKASKSKNLFLKKYDLQLRELFREYLLQNKNEFQEVLLKNQMLYVKELKIEKIAEDLVTKKYLSSFIGFLNFSFRNYDHPKEVASVFFKLRNYLQA